jgi:RHS repeat-associated protein
MLVPNRHGSSNSYRFGFQGQEKDDEIKGEGNSLNYTFRMHDPRVGRFFAVDPLTSEYPWYSPYQFSGNKVIACVELEGQEERWVIKDLTVIYEPGPKVGGYSSQEAARKALSQMFLKMNMPSTVKQPIFNRTTGEVRCNCLECKLARYPYHNLAARNSMGNPIFRFAAETLLTGGSSKVFTTVLPKAPLVVNLAKNYKKLAPVVNATAKVGANVGSQVAANEGKVEKTNMIEALSSPLPGEIPVVIGETVSYTPADISKGNLPSVPNFTSLNGLLKWGLQVSGGLASNKFGDATDNYLKGEKGGKVVGEFMKFNVETISNIAPGIVPDESEPTRSPDDFKTRNND